MNIKNAAKKVQAITAFNTAKVKAKNERTIDQSNRQEKDAEKSKAFEVENERLKAQLMAQAEEGDTPWTAVEDPETGKSYWYNTLTKETAWEKPNN